MTKEEAQQAVRDGKKVSHRRFTHEEFIYMEDGKLKDENGFILDWFQFWGSRESTTIFQNDWKLY